MKSAKDMPQFEFLGELGVGGTAQVHKIRISQNKIAALKTILESDNINKEEFKLLAQREYHLLQNINFPGIVKIYEVQTEEPCYISLEYCSGKTLERYNKIENLKTALNILSSIAVNLEFLHLKSIVHADLKPDNIFMPEDISLFATDRLTFTKLSDFSLGKFENEDDSLRGGAGTVGYMAPETIKDNYVSHSSDLFAFGVLAYQILSGVHPFISDETDPIKINSKVLEETPLPLSDYRNDLPDELIQLIDQLMEKDSSKRPSSAWEVCQILRQVGATFPFEKVLQPKYVIEVDNNYLENKKIVSNYSQRLETISNSDNSQLRMILTDNFNKNNMYYQERQFHFNANPLVASYLVRHEIKNFLLSPLSDKKTIIKKALENNNQNLISLIIPNILHTSTIKRISQLLATEHESKNSFSVATKLFISAGNLQKAEDMAYQAAMALKNDNNIDEAIVILDKAISYAKLLGSEFEVKSIIMVKGDFLKDTGEADKAEAVYHELIELYKGQAEDELLAETYKDLGDLYKDKKKPEDGIKSLKKALEIFISLENKLEISKTYNNLGNIYKVVNDFTMALSYFRKALRIQRKLSAVEEVASTLNNIAVVYAMTSKFKKALRIFKISLTIQKEIGNKREISRTLNNIGYCYVILGNALKAVEMLEEALLYNREIDNKSGVLINLETLTAIMYTSGSLKESISYLKEGISLATELQDKPHIGLFNMYMGSVLVRMGKINDALKSFHIVENILEEVEDDFLLAQLHIEKAQLAIFINNINDASVLLNTALTISEKIKDKPIIIKVLLLQLSIRMDSSLYPQAEEIIKELELKKENAYLSAINLNHSITENNFHNNSLDYEQLITSINSSDDNIEQCLLLNTLSKFELYNNNSENALHYIKRSIQLSKSRGLVFDQFQAIITYGEILRTQKEYEQCYKIYKKALEIAKEIYGQLDSDENKFCFQNKKEFVFLVSEIKQLSQIIGQKKEQI